MDLISIIIPVYKVESYLCECLDSVLSSTYANIEVILVDDGSPDLCPQICDEYAKKDTRVRVIHQKNGGLCAARNKGLTVANGKYIAFVDSDDVISPLLYEKLIALIQAEGADWAACEYTRKRENLAINDRDGIGAVHILEGFEQQLSVLTCAPSIRNVTWAGSYVWNKLYRKDKITKAFLEGCYNIEDLQFNWDYMQNCSRLATLSQGLYFYRVNEESITETYRKHQSDKIAKRGISIARTFEDIAEQTSADYAVLKEYLTSRAVNVMHGALFRIYAQGEVKKHLAFTVKAEKYIHKNWKTVYNDRDTYNLRAWLPVVMFRFVRPLWLLSTKLLKV